MVENAQAPTNQVDSEGRPLTAQSATIQRHTQPDDLFQPEIIDKLGNLTAQVKLTREGFDGVSQAAKQFHENMMKLHSDLASDNTRHKGEKIVIFAKEAEKHFAPMKKLITHAEEVVVKEHFKRRDLIEDTMKLDTYERAHAAERWSGLLLDMDYAQLLSTISKSPDAARAVLKDPPTRLGLNVDTNKDLEDAAWETVAKTALGDQYGHYMKAQERVDSIREYKSIVESSEAEIVEQASSLRRQRYKA